MKKKSTFTTIMLILVLIIGLSLLLYPTLSDYYNSQIQSKAIASYADDVAALDEDAYRHIRTDAIEYNKSLLTRMNGYSLTEEQSAQYSGLLNLSGDGVMGYIEIPSIGVALPVYHGTSEKVLQVAVGHLEWTSLPTGGESTHCVLSGHRGLPSAKLFTDLDQLREGDVFMIRVLNELLTYEVDQILIVEPDDVKELQIQQGKDLCTLVTCTPYGVNSHRLLVRGHRVANTEEAEAVRVTSDALQVEPIFIAVILFIPLLVLLLSIAIGYDRAKRKKKT